MAWRLKATNNFDSIIVTLPLCFSLPEDFDISILLQLVLPPMSNFGDGEYNRPRITSNSSLNYIISLRTSETVDNFFKSFLHRKPWENLSTLPRHFLKSNRL